MTARASPTAAPPPECCMCGDHGLPSELFRCRSCHSRYQHKYCSDLYPKAEHYKTCNWCLREEGGRKAPPPPEPANNSTSPTTGETNGGGARAKLQRGEFGFPNKPVKKQRPLLERSASDVILRTPTAAAEEISSSGHRARQLPARGKTRRYKLLEEVSS